MIETICIKNYIKEILKRREVWLRIIEIVFRGLWSKEGDKGNEDEIVDV